MKDFIKEASKTIGYFVFIGACAMVGIRAVEYIIPAPESRIAICFIGENETEECKILEDVIKDSVDE